MWIFQGIMEILHKYVTRASAYYAQTFRIKAKQLTKDCKDVVR